MVKNEVKNEKVKETQMEVNDFKRKRVSLKIKGITPLIVARFPERIRQELLNKQQQKSIKNKEARDPEKEYRESIHYTEDGQYGFPADGFKASAVRASKFIDGMNMIDTKGLFHVLNDMVVIHSKPPKMREDRVVIQKKIPSTAFRAQFDDWSTELDITYNASAISLEKIVQLFNTAGFAVGVGAWRPTCNGSFGQFEVVGATELK